MDLRGKTALVTGGSRRIGRAICLALAGEGIHVAFTFRRSAAEAEATRRDIEALGVRAAALEADLSDLDACDRLMEASSKLTGAVDILVNNASEFPKTPLGDLSRDREGFEGIFRYLTDLHMRAPLYLGMKLGLGMKAKGWGRIVNILDRVVARAQSYGDWILYLVTKYGLFGVNQALARELAPEVTVNGIAPGLVIPPGELSKDEVQRIIQKIPLRREAGVEEIAGDVLHLIRSGYKTGSVILTDGGAGLKAY